MARECAFGRIMRVVLTGFETWEQVGNNKRLAQGGCYVSGKSVMVPPKAETFGTMGRNIFRDTGFKNVDFSVCKTFKPYFAPILARIRPAPANDLLRASKCVRQF